MISTNRKSEWKFIPVSATIVLCALGVLSNAKPKSTPKVNESAQRAFSTAEDAAQALVMAAEVYDVAALREILGPAGEDLIVSEDPVADKNRAVLFAALAHQKSAVIFESKNRAGLVVGNDDWPLPIPILKGKGGWYFDSKGGREEILLRRIGEDELNAIQICRGFVEAQKEYALTRHEGSGINQYAQRIISTPGTQDGLAWQDKDGKWGGPVGEIAAKALQEGYKEHQPYHGYFFKVLRGQGPAAPIGLMDFVVNGAMIGGFALVAAPAQYGVTGVQTFMVSHDGVVYQKDFGPNTLEAFQRLERYDPDKTWQPTNDEP